MSSWLCGRGHTANKRFRAYGIRLAEKGRAGAGVGGVDGAFDLDD